MSRSVNDTTGAQPDPVPLRSSEQPPGPQRRLPAGFRPAAPGAEPAPARDAATVVLLRDGSAGPEAYLLRRPATMAFAAGMYVFPGGGVDPRDAGLAPRRWAGPPPAEWAGPLTATPEVAAALVAAAIRETFEESGVLLAGAGPDEVVADVAGEQWQADRRALLERRLGLAELLDRRRLVLRSDLLRAWAHWVTPQGEPRRYDTRFFVAALPAGQQVESHTGEADHALWLRPADALAAHTRGEIGLLPPTSFTLAELTGYDSVAAVLAAGRRRDIRPVLPRIVLADDEQAVLLLPGEPGYEA